jgi:hypothetical protein
VDALTDGIDHTQARATARESIRIAHDEGLTTQLLYVVFVAAALAARRDDIERAVVLLDGARRASPVEIGGGVLISACRVYAQAAVDSYPGDLTAARSHRTTMTVDELTTYALDTLD